MFVIVVCLCTTKASCTTKAEQISSGQTAHLDQAWTAWGCWCSLGSLSECGGNCTKYTLLVEWVDLNTSDLWFLILFGSLNTLSALAGGIFNFYINFMFETYFQVFPLCKPSGWVRNLLHSSLTRSLQEKLPHSQLIPLSHMLNTLITREYVC